MKSAALVLLATGIVLGASMVQTDWSNGPSGEITTTDWGSSFGSCLGMGWQTQGVLTLGKALVGDPVSYSSAWRLRSLNANGDPFTDVISRSGSSIKCFYSTGSVGNWPYVFAASSYPDSFVTFFPGDLNGDGLDDIIGGNGTLTWWENPGDTRAWTQRVIDNIDPTGGFVVDYDGNGLNDIICTHNILNPGYLSMELALYRNLGEGLTWEKTVLYAKDTYTGPEITGSYITGDGYLSVAILISQFPSPMINILRDGPSGWYVHKVLAPPYSLSVYNIYVSFVDLNNDGTADLLAGAQGGTHGRIRWYQGPNFYPHYTFDIGENILGVTAVDFDNDGDKDIIYRGTSSLGIYENTRSPQERFVQRVLMEYPFVGSGIDLDGAGGLVAPGDFDGDGVEDFVCSFWAPSGGYTAPYWWRLGEDYCSSGWLNSDILYVYDASWGELSWEASVPAETQLFFQVRGSDDPGNLGEWSGLLYAPVDLSAYLAEGESYMQYRVTMLSDNPGVSPQLNSVTVTYDPLGVEENTESGLRVFPSPVGSVATVSLTLPEPAECTVAVFSLNGRLVGTVSEGSLPAGENALVWDASSVPSGVYFVRVSGAGADLGARVVVVR